MVRRTLLSSLCVFIALEGPASSQSVAIPVIQPLPAVPSSPTPPSASGQTFIPTAGAGSEWDRARAQLRMSASTPMAQAVSRWKTLSRYDNLAFADYSSFLVAYPGFPEEDKLRRYAEKALERGGASAAQIAAYFDRVPPLSNPARAQYAVALGSIGRSESGNVALAAWRGGAMSDAAEAAIAPMIFSRAAAADHDARMDALLWAGSIAQAQRQIGFVSPGKRPLFMARLAAAQGSDPATLGIALPPGSGADPGWLYNRSRQLIAAGRGAEAAAMLANRGALAERPADPERWVTNLLAAARNADAGTAIRLAASVDDAFAPGTDISQATFRLRDDYTSLMWLGGTKAMWSFGTPRNAAPLFWRYGKAAKTPQTRSKGFYWAGRALAKAGDAGATAYFEQAAAYPDQFYGQLALERLGRQVPRFSQHAAVSPSVAERQTFLSRPLAGAVREVARDSDWATTVRFFREIADQASTAGEHQLVADMARDLGRRDLGVIVGQAAGASGLADFQHVAFPLIPTPDGTDWTMVHAISRQESQFAENAVSHAGARGLMQLMPGTAREQAGKVGLSYEPGSLMNNPGYNIRLGDGYFARMLRYYGGSYPLAVAAYNAGPGNVNKWLRANGDPRTGSVDWIDWFEKIPVSETRNYVQRVLENAVVYEAMHPERARFKGANPLSRFIGKQTPG